MNEKKHILIVDDEVELVEIMKMRLEAAGFEITAAHNGEEGLGKAKKEMPNLIILDLMLPTMDGYKVCGLLKRDHRYARIPIIMFTARAQEEDRKIAEEVGADVYMTKPFDGDALLEKIKELIGKKD